MVDWLWFIKVPLNYFTTYTCHDYIMQCSFIFIISGIKVSFKSAQCSDRYRKLCQWIGWQMQGCNRDRWRFFFLLLMAELVNWVMGRWKLAVLILKTLITLPYVHIFQNAVSYCHYNKPYTLFHRENLHPARSCGL